MAGKFKFKLQPLLNVKIQIEDSLKNEFGKAMLKLEQEKERLSLLEYERKELIGTFNERSAQGVMVKELREYTAYISHMKEKMDLQKENINAAQRNVDKCREELIKASREREIIEKLKEKKYQEYLKEILKEEQKTNDEVVSYSYNNRIAGDENG
ncbi:MAG: flagellar export protein FliJ [Clostridia bacterium]|nr:flagellar export protein FliJ [Clostridia bacterium]